jgi:hypothetical protein
LVSRDRIDARMESIEHTKMFWYYALEIPSTLLQCLCNANCTLILLYVPSFMLGAASVDCALVCGGTLTLKEEVFIRAPASAEHLAGDSGRVLRLRRAFMIYLQGSRQAPRAWNQRLETELRSRWFVQCDADPALWILHGEIGTVLSILGGGWASGCAHRR